mgnify:CR=1 FL=1
MATEPVIFRASRLTRGNFWFPAEVEVSPTSVTLRKKRLIGKKEESIHIAHIASIKMYYKAGGRIAMGTDAGTPHNRHGENARELEYMCEIGISTRDSLFISTASAADLMRLADQGRIKEGNSADFVLCDGDPLADIKRAARKENHRLVVKRGQVARDNRAAFVPAARRVAAE